jgi:F0F1-type ATP synthase membrane subunit c/vacuolar-type H+-ATPase subunit K
MPHRTAKWLPVLLIGVLAGTALTLVPSPPAQAEECLSAPKAATPAGGHWRYRVERGTKRHCWYLAEKARTTPDAAAAAEPSTTAPQRSLADARAELVAEPTRSDTVPESVWPAPEKSAAPSDSAPSAAAPEANPAWPLASRWADNVTTANPETTAIVANTSAETATSAVVSAATAAPSPSPLRSQAMLIAGLAAALGLAGLIVRLVVGLAASRPIIRREQGLHSRPIFDVEIRDMPAPPWLASPPATPRAPEPDVGIEAEPPPLNWVRVARARSQADRTSDAIEELLAKAAPRPSLGTPQQG